MSTVTLHVAVSCVMSALGTTCCIAQGSLVVGAAGADEVVHVVGAGAVDTRVTGTLVVVYKQQSSDRRPRMNTAHALSCVKCL